MVGGDAGGGPVTASESSAQFVQHGVASGVEGQVFLREFNAGPAGQSMQLEEKSESLGKESVAGMSRG